MEKMVNVFLMGKKYEVPSSLTIMGAMEYAGYQLRRLRHHLPYKGRQRA